MLWTYRIDVFAMVHPGLIMPGMATLEPVHTYLVDHHTPEPVIAEIWARHLDEAGSITYRQLDQAEPDSMVFNGLVNAPKE